MSQPTVTVHGFARPDAELLHALADAHTPDLANVLGVDAVADPELRPIWRGARVLGPALTVQLATGDNLGAMAASVQAQPGDVMVVDSGGSTTAIVGALISRSAVAHGVAGLVIDGAVRDVAELEELRIPVWSRHVCPRQSTKTRDASIGVPVRCGGLTVQPGDLVLADDDGIVFASAARLRGALEAIRKVIATEQRLKDPEALAQAIRGLLAAVTIAHR